MTTKARKGKRRRRGRPRRAEASAKALKGIDPGTVDPRAVLAEVAVDRSAPAAARVAAAKLLMRGKKAEPAAPEREAEDATNARALKIIKGGRDER